MLIQEPTACKQRQDWHRAWDTEFNRNKCLAYIGPCMEAEFISFTNNPNYELTYSTVLFINSATCGGFK